MIIGHNAGLHELALALAVPEGSAYRSLAQGKFPTTARASFAVEGGWAMVGKSRYRLIDYVKSMDAR